MTIPKTRTARLGRDTLIILAGLAGLYHETLIAREPRDALVWLFGGFVLGVPFLHQGDKQKDEEKEEK